MDHENKANLPQAPNEPVKPESQVVAADAVMAKPPEGAVFTEVPSEHETAAQPGVVINSAAETIATPPAEAAEPLAALPPTPAVPIKAVSKLKKPAGPKKPVLGIMVAAAVFVVLAALAFYAYSKST